MATEHIEIFSIPVYQTVLKSGLTVIVAEIESKVVVCKLAIRGGSSIDGEYLGAAHFLEHLVSQGSEKGGAHPIMMPLILKGCNANAATTPEVTEYFTGGLSHLYKELLNAITSIVFQAQFDQLHLDRERSVILQELRRNAKQRADAVKFRQDFFPDRTNLHHTPAGTEESVKGMTHSALEIQYNRWYFPGNAVLVVAGDCNNEKILDHLSSIQLQHTEREPAPLEPNSGPMPAKVCYPAETGPSFIELIFPRPLVPTGDHLLLNLCNKLLIDGNVGLITSQLRHKMRSVYSCRANTLGDVLRWAEIGTDCQPDLFDEVERVFWESIQAVRSLTFDLKMFEIVKARAETVRAFEDTPAVNYNIPHWLTKLTSDWVRGKFSPQIPATILSQATPEDMARIANTYYRPELAGRIIIK